MCSIATVLSTTHQITVTLTGHSRILGPRLLENVWTATVTVFRHTLGIGATLFHGMKVNRVDMYASFHIGKIHDKMN